MLARRVVLVIAACLLLVPLNHRLNSRSQSETQTSVASLPGLQDKVRVIRDETGIPHIFAGSDHDVYFMMGYIHAQDRFFQMDVSRRQASGTLAELLGPGPGDLVLNSDIQLRTIGLRRAAQHSRAAYSSEAIAVLHAYAAGVNAWLKSESTLPPEYGGLELTKTGIPLWEDIDSIAIIKLIAFGLSFDASDLTNTQTLVAYQTAGAVAGFEGAKLFFEDLFRSAPFAPTVSITSQQNVARTLRAKTDLALAEKVRSARKSIKPQTMAAIRSFLNATSDVSPLSKQNNYPASNWWVISAENSETGVPMLANDPHLSLVSPPLFYEIHLNVYTGRNQMPMNVYGVSFPGVPGIVQGFNEKISWGSTVNPLDVTDFYQERIIVNASGLPVATFFRGNPEPLTFIPEIYKINRVGNSTPDDIIGIAPGPRPTGVVVPPATLVVPRRNNGPLITAPSGPDAQHLTALSVQYSGFSATRELEAFLSFARAQNIEEFKRGLQFFDFGSQNWSYIDTAGNIAYFTSSELPLREDLQAGIVDGLPPFFIRDGTGARRNEWIRNDNPPPDQALRFEILPFQEMPQVINPSQGFIANANNDPVGTTLDNNPLNQLRRGGQGILYFAPGYSGGYRLGRIDRLIRRELERSQGGDGTISLEDMVRIQRNVQMLDAEVMTPYILQSFQSARAPGAPPFLAVFGGDPALAQAVTRLGNWNFSAPTGIAEGYDAVDLDGIRRAPDSDEIAHSIAATIYSLWRGQIVRNTIDATLQRVGLANFSPANSDLAMRALRNLLDNFGSNGGRGASGLSFFDVPGVNLSPAAERDIIILQSLRDALNLLASDAFAPAFGKSTNQEDYRWGKLHRIVFRHPLGSPFFNIPPGAGFSDLSPALPGLSTDGGFEVVDASSHAVRATSLRGFMFTSGPSRRFIGEARHDRVRAVEIIPGGESGIPQRPFFGNMLGHWLTNDYHEAHFTTGPVMSNQISREDFQP